MAVNSRGADTLWSLEVRVGWGAAGPGCCGCVGFLAVVDFEDGVGVATRAVAREERRVPVDFVVLERFAMRPRCMRRGGLA